MKACWLLAAMVAATTTPLASARDAATVAGSPTDQPFAGGASGRVIVLQSNSAICPPDFASSVSQSCSA